MLFLELCESFDMELHVSFDKLVDEYNMYKLGEGRA
jgi:hypothetical protein